MDEAEIAATPPEAEVNGRLAQGAWHALFAASTALLIAAFLLGRHDDIGRLPADAVAFMRAFATGPVVTAAGLARAAAGVALALAIGASWYGFGLLLRPSRGRVDDSCAPAAEFAERVALGAGVTSLAWFGLGTLHLYHRPLAILVLGVGLALAAVGTTRQRPRWPHWRPVTGAARLAVVVVGVTQALGLIAALAPPTAKDTLLYHLALPKAYVAAGGMIDSPGNIAQFYPLGAEMQAVWALLLGGGGGGAGEAAAGAVLFLWSPIVALLVYGWARELGASRTWSALAVAMVVGVPTAYHVSASGYVDMALAAYVALASRAAARWWTAAPGTAWLWRAAAATGFALSVKLTAAILVVALAALVVLRFLRDGVSLPHVHETVIAGVGGAALGSPWYLRNWLGTGNPVFPFYGGWSGAIQGWDGERAQLFGAMFAVYGGSDKGIVEYVLSPLRIAILAQPEQPTYFDGVLGVALLAGTLVLCRAIYAGVLPPGALVAAGFSAVLFVGWLFTSQQLRYLMPACPGWAVAIGVAGSAVTRASRRIRPLAAWSVAVAVTVAVLVSVAWFVQQDVARVVLGGESRSAFLSRRLDYYPYYALINSTLPATSRVWLVDVRRDTYHLDRPYMADFIFEDWTLSRWVREAASPEALRARVRAAGVTHIFLRHDVLMDYARSPIVDDRLPRSDNEARLRLLTSFFADSTRTIRADRKFALVEILDTSATTARAGH